MQLRKFYRVAMKAAFAATIVIGVGFSGLDAWAQVTVNVNSGTRYQTIDGFGTFMEDSVEIGSSTYQQLFAQDLGASIVRFDVDPNCQTSLDTNLNALNTNLISLSGATDLQNSVTWGKAVNSDKLDQMEVYMSVWTPPAFMKNNDAQIEGGFLLPNMYPYFGKYLAAYVTAYTGYSGLPVYAVSIQNELRFVEPYVSCVYTPQQLDATIDAVGAAFKQFGITTKIEAPEDVFQGYSQSGAAADYLPNAPTNQYEVDNEMEFIEVFQNDPLAAGYHGIFNVHKSGPRFGWSELKRKQHHLLLRRLYDGVN